MCIDDLYIVEVWATDVESVRKHIDSVFAIGVFAKDRARQAVKEITNGTYASEKYKVHLFAGERVFATVTLVSGDDICRRSNNIVFAVDSDGTEFETADCWLYDLVDEDPYWDCNGKPEEA